MESVGMEGVCCNYYFIFSFTLCPHPPESTSPKQIKNLLMNNNNTGHLLLSDICTVLVTLAFTSVQYFTLGLTQTPSRHVFLACILRAPTSDSLKRSTLEAIWHIPDGRSVDLTWKSADGTSCDGLQKSCTIEIVTNPSGFSSSFIASTWFGPVKKSGWEPFPLFMCLVQAIWNFPSCQPSTWRMDFLSFSLSALNNVEIHATN